MRTLILVCTLLLGRATAHAALTAPHDDFACDVYSGECEESPHPDEPHVSALDFARHLAVILTIACTAGFAGRRIMILDTE